MLKRQWCQVGRHGDFAVGSTGVPVWSPHPLASNRKVTPEDCTLDILESKHVNEEDPSVYPVFLVLLSPCFFHVFIFLLLKICVLTIFPVLLHLEQKMAQI